MSEAEWCPADGVLEDASCISIGELCEAAWVGGWSVSAVGVGESWTEDVSDEFRIMSAVGFAVDSEVSHWSMSIGEVCAVGWVVAAADVTFCDEVCHGHWSRSEW